MKKKLVYIAAVLICLSIMTGGTLAYFTAEDTARNVITTGGIQVTVVEQQLVDGELCSYPAQPISVMPGAQVSKIVSVRNDSQTAWIRMAYEIVVYDSQGAEKQVPQEELAEIILIEHDTESWTFTGGWWYYNTAVKGGETTKPLFEGLSFSGPAMGNEYQNCTVQVIVTAQAVQQANNADAPDQAAGWPE